MWLPVFMFSLFSISCYGQAPPPVYPTYLHNGLSERIGNFSLEILYYISQIVPPNENLVVSPFTMWTALVMIAEGATDKTLYEIKNATRFWGRKAVVRKDFADIAQWLKVNTSTVELAKVNALFLDSNTSLENDFRHVASNYYDAQVAPLNFSDKVKTANTINQFISTFTHGRIPKLVDSDYFENAKLLLISALYFKGQWTKPFNASFTEKRPFYDSNGQKLGDVNMMQNKYTYPFANIKEIQARVIEIPYGVEDRLSMLIILPNKNISLGDMFLRLADVPLDIIFKELLISKKEYGEDEVDCRIPRFKLQSNLFLNPILKQMGIHDLFDPNAARLPELARTPLYVSRVMHKAEIEVTEEGTTASAVTSVEFSNRIATIPFEANRPFVYVIVEKVTNSIVFGGLYRQPSLY